MGVSEHGGERAGPGKVAATHTRRAGNGGDVARQARVREAIGKAMALRELRAASGQAPQPRRVAVMLDLFGCKWDDVLTSDSD